MVAARRIFPDAEAILHSLTQILERIRAQVDSDALFLHSSKWRCLARSYTIVLDTVAEFTARNSPGMLYGPLMHLRDAMLAGESFLMECICSNEVQKRFSMIDWMSVLAFGESTVMENTHLHDLLWCVSVLDRASKGLLFDNITAQLYEIWIFYFHEKRDLATTLHFVETQAGLHKDKKDTLRLTSFIIKKLSLSLDVERVISKVLPDYLWADPKDLDRHNDPIGQGANAYVFQTEWLGGQYAVKDFFNANHGMFEQEAAILARLRHPNVVQLVCCTKDLKRRKCSLVMELLHMNLRTLLTERMEGASGNFKPFSLLTSVDLMLQIAKGMEYLHSHNIIHRDLKSLNILVGYPKMVGDSYTHLHLKIADFGMSETKYTTGQYRTSSSKLGTTHYRAPEIFHIEPIGSDQQCAKYSKMADVFSFGLICYEILTGRVPFHECSRLLQYDEMRAGVRPNLPSDCPSALASCISKCWNWEATHRPTFTQICRMLRHIKACIVLAADDEKLAKQMLFCTVIPDETHERIDECMLKKGKVGGATMSIPLEMECCQDVFKGIIVSPDPVKSPVEKKQTNYDNIFLQRCVEILDRIQMMVGTHDLVFLHRSKWQCLEKSYSLVLEALRLYQKLSSEYSPGMFIGPVTLFSDVLQEGEKFLMKCSKSYPSESLDDRAACLSNMSKVLRFATTTEIVDVHLHDLVWCLSVFDRAWKDLDIFGAFKSKLLQEAQCLGQEIRDVWVDANEEEDQVVALQFMTELKLAKDNDTEMSALADFILHKLASWSATDLEDGTCVPSYLWVDPKSFKRSNNPIAAGGYGMIFSAEWGGQTFALKDFFDVEDFSLFGREVAIQARLQHANVMPLVCCTKELVTWKCTIVMEEMQQNLRHLIRERLLQVDAGSPPFSLLTAVDLMLQIAKGMEYLHSLHIVHRDLKSFNILVSFPTVSSNEQYGEHLHLKISDFGMAKAKSSLTTRNVGSSQWRAPEVFDKDDVFDEDDLYPKYTNKADVYSFAMVCYEVLTGNIPFQDKVRKLRVRILSGERPLLPPSCPPVLSNYINECWHTDPTRRPTFTEICIMLRHIKACIVLSSHQKSALQMLSCQVSVHHEPLKGVGSGSVEGLLCMTSDMEFCRAVFSRHVRNTEHGHDQTSGDEHGHDVKCIEHGHASTSPIQTHRHRIRRRWFCLA